MGNYEVIPGLDIFTIQHCVGLEIKIFAYNIVYNSCFG